MAIIFADKVASEEFNLSLEFGWNFSTVSNFTDIKRTNATIFGLGCNFKLSEQFYLSPLVCFLSKRKFNFSSYSLNTGNDNIDNEFMNKSGDGNLSYIDVPVLLWYEINKVRLGVGPQVSFLTKSILPMIKNCASKLFHCEKFISLSLFGEAATPRVSRG